MATKVVKRRPPTPAELRHQFFGAAMGIAAVKRMIEHAPNWWVQHGDHVLTTLYSNLVEVRDEDVHGEQVWNVLMALIPEHDIKVVEA